MTYKHRRRTIGLRVLAAVIALAWTTSSFADDEKGAFTVLWENDAVAGTDHHYTNGVEFSYLSVEDHLWDWFRKSSEVLPGVGPNDRLRVGLSLGQSIFTPDDKATTSPLPDQRPYAGWLYLGVAVVANHGDQLDTWVLDLGVVGPDAKGEQVQNGFHDFIVSSHANGWGNQLVNKFGYQLLFEHRWSHVTPNKVNVGRLQLDFSPHVGFSLGNVETYANAGLTIRIGADLRDDFGVPRIRPSLPGSDYFVPQDKFGWYVFAGIDARAVAYNIFLQGQPATYDIQIMKEKFVYDGQAGFALIWRKVRLAYTYVIRSHEYLGQGQPDRFGSVGMTTLF